MANMNDTAPDKKPPALTALQLRRIAEKASGLRKNQLILAYGTGGTLSQPVWDLIDPKNSSKYKEPMIDVNPPRDPSKPSTGANWGTIDSVTVVYGPDHRSITLSGYDAYFWSQAAVEKFVLGYYLPLLEPIDWTSLYMRVMSWSTTEPLYGIAHTYPSIPEVLGTNGMTGFLTKDGMIPEDQYIKDARAMLEASSIGKAIWAALASR